MRLQQESLSGTFSRFPWQDPTRPSGDAALQVSEALRNHAAVPPELRNSVVVSTVAALAGHLHAPGESRERAVAAIRRELETVATGESRQPTAVGAWSATMLDEVVLLAVEACYGRWQSTSAALATRDTAASGR